LTISATKLLGKPVQEAILEEVKGGLAALAASGQRPPKLAAVLVGEDPASAMYVRTKTRTCAELGIDSEAIVLPDNTSTEELLARVDALNADDGVDGILVQLPLPDGIDTEAVLDRIDPSKDVDGLHAENVGMLVQKRSRFVPATPGGIMQMLDRAGIEIEGANAVIIGRSEIVGKPVSLLLLHRHATVTICHSRTRELAAVARQADILVAAVGVPRLVKADWIKPGAAVIDVGVTEVDGKLVGDVDFEAACEVAGAITPVPGGVGPMTIACLLHNTLEAACRQNGLAVPGENAAA